MINLILRTEFCFDTSNRVFGKLSSVVQRIKELGQSAAAITDNTTFGHVQWLTECNKAGVRPLLGAEVRVPIDADYSATYRLHLIAKNNDGLAELYALTSAAVSEALSLEAVLKSSKDVIKLLGTTRALTKAESKLCRATYADIGPATPPDIRAARFAGKEPIIAVGDNRYPKIDDRAAFSLFGGSVTAHAQHILSEREARVYVPGLPDSAYTISDQLAQGCSCDLPVASNMQVKGDLEKLCRAGIRERLGRWTKRYEERLVHELGMIREKKFESYFLIISDMVRYAKKHMVVGPARGSAAGSLVCFLAYITDIDPIPHGLLFERFIDVTRSDLPDIDLDFPDEKREIVINYLQQKYGEHNVVHIGTTLTLQPKSILRLVSKKLGVKMFEFQPLLDTMIERSSGDSRASMCLLDTLEEMEAGKTILQRYPQVRTATSFEGHANGAGTHAAGIIVCSEPVRKYCTVDSRDSTAQIDKGDAEKLNLLKIDILGLRTLSVLEHTVAQLPQRIDLNRIPLDDRKAFELLNAARFAGIFQFEGDAVQMLTKQMRIERFEDIVALGALARPGPLNSGGATEWANRRMGRARTIYLHPLIEPETRDTYGIVVYQEQVMSIGRKVGQLDWDDITELRKAMSKSKGEEFFNQYYKKFLAGALKHGMKESDARHIWDNMQTMGSWAFNKSHAVSYGLISYWCAYLKSHYPLEFAAATLKHTKGEYQTITLLRELRNEGIDYVAFDARRSRENWEVIDGNLVGGFINLKGIGETTARELVSARSEGWTEKQIEKIVNAEVLYSDVYPTETRFGPLYRNPQLAFSPEVDRLWTAAEIDQAKAANKLPNRFFFIGKLVDKVPRSLNEYGFQVKRIAEGKDKLVPKDREAYLNLVLEDDTGRIWATVNWRMYQDVGLPIVNEGITGESWYIMRGMLNQIGRINITWAKDITNGAGSYLIRMAA